MKAIIFVLAILSVTTFGALLPKVNIKAKTGKQVNLANGLYAILSESSGMAFEVQKNSQAEGANVTTSAFKTEQFQLFILTAADNNETYTFQSVTSKKFIGITKGSKGNGGLSVHTAAKPEAYVTWRLVVGPHGTAAVQNVESGKFMTARAGAGSQVFVSNRNNRQQQLFRFIKLDAPALPLEAEKIYFLINDESGLVLDFASKKAGASITGTPYKGGHYGSNNQYFTLKKAGGDYFNIIYVGSKLAVTTTLDKGALKITQAALKGTDAEKWKFIPNEHGYSIENKAAKLVLTLAKKAGEPATFAALDKKNESQRFIPSNKVKLQ